MKTTKRVATLAAVPLLAVLAAAGCGSASHPAAHSAPSATQPASAAATPPTSSSQPAAGASAPAAAAVITISSFAYSVPAHISPGEKLTVRNRDNVAHTVTADNGSAFAVAVPPSASATFTAPAKAGTYPFHCTYHANMHGKLTVG
jgi:plastocyanin